MTARFFLRKLDDLLRRSINVFEFNHNPDCLLRLQLTPAWHSLHLPNLTLETGDPVLLIHLWNERLPPFSPENSDLSWARCILHRFKYSLYLVADYLLENPQLSEVRAVGGETIILTAGLHAAGLHFVQSLGFTVIPYSSRLGFFGEFWENFYSWLLIWAYNPASLPRRSIFSLHRSEMWMSRDDFIRRFRKKGVIS